MDELEQVIEKLAVEHRRVAELDERTIRLPRPVSGDPSYAVLEAIGLAQDGSPVGAAAHGPAVVAACVWRQPELLLARWSAVTRWVVGYRVPAATRIDTLLRTEGRIPTNLETGQWRGEVPDEVALAFLEVGLSLDEPPFPPPPPPPVAAPTRASKPRAGASPSRPRKAAAPKPTRPKAAVPATRVCPACHMQKAVVQFEPDSDLCADCR